MTKTFYVIVPYAITAILGTGALAKQFNVSSMLGSNKSNTKTGISDEEFEKCKSQLWQRMEFVALGLRRSELDSIPLTTPELIELLWSIHHPDEAEIGYSPQILPELLK